MAGKTHASSRVSVIIPALNEEENIGETLDSALSGNPFEIFVIDGGSTDRTVHVARSYPAVTVIISEERGRSAQMNRGAEVCNGDVILFLHADTTLPDGWLPALSRVMEKRKTAGGCFFVRLSGIGVIYRFIERMINVKTLVLNSFSGDQAIFVKKDLFASVGGFPPVPIMEDLIFADKLRKLGKPAVIRKPVTTSARNWERWGPIKTIFLMWYMKILFRLGRDPGELAPHYRWGTFPPLFEKKFRAGKRR